MVVVVVVVRVVGLLVVALGEAVGAGAAVVSESCTRLAVALLKSSS